MPCLRLKLNITVHSARAGNAYTVYRVYRVYTVHTVYGTHTAGQVDRALIEVQELKVDGAVL